MLRPMTSSVSALSSSVANGHQAIHSVSSAPSKIPYGGFSPVRLQTRCRVAAFTRVHARIYRRLQPPSRIHPLLMPGYLGLRPNRACRIPSQALWSSGPWLRQRLCCPPASSLTMATSELLRRSPGFGHYVRRISRVAEGPHFYLPRLADVPPSLPRWFQGPLTNPTLGLAFAKSEQARQPFDPHTGLRVADFTRLQRSLHAAARQLASPAPDRTFTTELPCAKSPRHKSVMTTGTFISSQTGLSPVALTALWAALRLNPTHSGCG
jgi:hypothetical protein